MKMFLPFYFRGAKSLRWKCDWIGSIVRGKAREQESRSIPRQKGAQTGDGTKHDQHTTGGKMQNDE